MSPGRRTSHYAFLQQSGKRFKIRCHQCDFGQDVAGYSYPARESAREAADAHMLFTHTTGGKPCGVTGCAADRTMRRLQPKKPRRSSLREAVSGLASAQTEAECLAILLDHVHPALKAAYMPRESAPSLVEASTARTNDN